MLTTVPVSFVSLKGTKKCLAELLDGGRDYLVDEVSRKNRKGILLSCTRNMQIQSETGRWVAQNYHRKMAKEKLASGCHDSNDLSGETMYMMETGTKTKINIKRAPNQDKKKNN